jgi:hypothetical protein
VEPIHIPAEVAEAAGVPEDLDSARGGPYRFPPPSRRRVAAAVYGLSAVVVALVVPGGKGLWFALGLAGLAVWHLLASWPLAVSPEMALGKAAAAAPFPVGHSSAAVTFHGVRARPRWHVVLYDADNPPAQRALVVVDAVTGAQVGEVYVEDLAVAPDS